MDKLKTLLKQVTSTPDNIEFQDVIDTINDNYDYTPTRFHNGPDEHRVTSKAGENEGSCKIFAFALLNNLNEQQTLSCFGQYYRNDVLNYPDNTDHANIRNFIKYGWKNIVFDGVALKYKKA